MRFAYRKLQDGNARKLAISKMRSRIYRKNEIIRKLRAKQAIQERIHRKTAIYSRNGVEDPRTAATNYNPRTWISEPRISTTICNRKHNTLKKPKNKFMTSCEMAGTNKKLSPIPSHRNQLARHQSAYSQQRFTNNNRHFLSNGYSWENGDRGDNGFNVQSGLDNNEVQAVKCLKKTSSNQIPRDYYGNAILNTESTIRLPDGGQKRTWQKIENNKLVTYTEISHTNEPYYYNTNRDVGTYYQENSDMPDENNQLEPDAETVEATKCVKKTCTGPIIRDYYGNAILQEEVITSLPDGGQKRTWQELENGEICTYEEITHYLPTESD